MNVKTACQGTAVKSFLHLDTTLTRIIFFYSYIYFLKASVKRTLRKMEHKIANLHKTTLSLAIMPQSATHMNYLQMWTAHCCLIYHQYILAYSSLYIFLHSAFSIFIQSLETMLLLLLPLALHFQQQQRFYFYKRYSRVFIHSTRVLVFIDFSLSLSVFLLGFNDQSMIMHCCQFYTPTFFR